MLFCQEALKGCLHGALQWGLGQGGKGRQPLEGKEVCARAVAEAVPAEQAGRGRPLVAVTKRLAEAGGSDNCRCG